MTFRSRGLAHRPHLAVGLLEFSRLLLPYCNPWFFVPLFGLGPGFQGVNLLRGLPCALDPPSGLSTWLSTWLLVPAIPCVLGGSPSYAGRSLRPSETRIFGRFQLCS